MVIVPVENTPQAPLDWQAFRLTGSDSLADRAAKKLRNDELMVTVGGTVLRTEMDKIPLWRENHVEIKQLAEDFARYTYLPRLKSPEVLVQAVRDGLGLLLWNFESFAYADSYDEVAKRYRGLRAGQVVPLSADSLNGVLVKPDVAVKQQKEEHPNLLHLRVKAGMNLKGNKESQVPRPNPGRNNPQKQAPNAIMGQLR